MTHLSIDSSFLSLSLLFNSSYRLDSSDIHSSIVFSSPLKNNERKQKRKQNKKRMISFSNQIERRKHFFFIFYFYWVTNLSARHEGKKILDPVGFHLFLSLSLHFPSHLFTFSI